jgi:hypothetical protein
MTTILPDVGESEAFEEQDYTPKKPKGVSPFEFVKNINGPASDNWMRDTGNVDLAEKSYNPWVVNLALSYFPDTILHANMVNELHFLDNRPQYEFLLNSIRPKKRYAKWIKNTGDEDLDAICKHYECNRNVGRDYLSLLSSEQIEMIRQRQKIGGIGNGK